MSFDGSGHTLGGGAVMFLRCEYPPPACLHFQFAPVTLLRGQYTSNQTGVKRQVFGEGCEKVILTARDERLTTRRARPIMPPIIILSLFRSTRKRHA